MTAQRTYWGRLLCVVVLVLYPACRGSQAARHVARGVTATALGRLPVVVPARGVLRVEARNVRGDARPVLHLWDPAARVELAASGPPSSRGAVLEYRSASAGSRSCELLVRAAGPGAGGRVDLFRDGQRLVGSVAVGGRVLELAPGEGITYQVAATPGAPSAAGLWALDAEGHIVGFDESSGPTGLPRLGGAPAIARLLLAPIGAASGRFSVYANDSVDRDGDGLGRRLERALGTCDSAAARECERGPLAEFFRSLPSGTRDSDRDGLSDADELFGAPGPGLDLPRYGADPRHKDVFVEIDHHRDLDDIGFSESELAEIAALYARGGASDLQNPDGLPGLRLHFDAGFTPREPAHLALFGDYGGSGPAQAAEYRAARRLDFSPERSGYFRYAFSTRRGRGQANRDSFTVNRDLQRVTIFAHELGHTLGLAHHGHDSWGKVNCKPNYFSIMNYLYQNRYEVGFSRSGSRVLNPASVLERGALPRTQAAAVLREPPLELDVFGRDVDWNRDGIISSGAVRADLLWATYKSCAAGEHGLQTLASDDLAPATPVLIGDRSQQLALWIDGAARVRLRRRGLEDAGLQPSAWDAARTLGLSDVVQIGGLMLPDGRFALAYVRRDGALHVATFVLVGASPRLISDVGLEGARTQHVPALAEFSLSPSLYGSMRAFGVVYRTSSGELEQALALAPEGPFFRRALRDGRGDLIRSARGPSLAKLPSGELCGAFPDAESFIRMYCYDVARDRFVDLSARAFDVELGPRTSGRAALAFHRFRDATGEPPDGDPSRGALFLSFTEPESSASLFADNPHFYVSEWLNRVHGAFEQLSMRWRGRVITEWTNLAPGTSVALHENEGSTHLQALMVLRSGSGALRLDYLPYADGEFDQPLRSGNDFQVMERGVCLGLRSERECGGPETGRY